MYLDMALVAPSVADGKYWKFGSRNSPTSELWYLRTTYAKWIHVVAEGMIDARDQNQGL